MAGKKVLTPEMGVRKKAYVTVGNHEVESPSFGGFEKDDRGIAALYRRVGTIKEKMEELI